MDGLKKLPKAQKEAIEYLTFLYPDEKVEILTHDGFVIYKDAERAAIIAPNGNFMDPDTLEVILTPSGYAKALQLYRAAEAAANN